MAQTQQIISHRVAGNFSATIHSFEVCTGRCRLNHHVALGFIIPPPARDTFWVRCDNGDVTYLSLDCMATADPGEEV